MLLNKAPLVREDQAKAIPLPWHHPVRGWRVLYVILNACNYGLFPFRTKCKVNGRQRNNFDVFLALQCVDDVCLNRICRIICHTSLVLLFLL